MIVEKKYSNQIDSIEASTEIWETFFNPLVFLFVVASLCGRLRVLPLMGGSRVILISYFISLYNTVVIQVEYFN